MVSYRLNYVAEKVTVFQQNLLTPGEESAVARRGLRRLNQALKGTSAPHKA